MSMKTHITLHDLAKLSGDAEAKLWNWWPVALGDLYVDQETGDVEMVGDTGIYNCVVKDHEHYDKTAPLLSIAQMIQYLDDHGLYQDLTTGMTHADGIAAERLCNWLWDMTRAHLEYGQDGTPELEYSGAVSR